MATAEVWRVWLRLRAPSGVLVECVCRDRSMAHGAVLTFPTMAEASAYADQRQAWYDRRHQFCETFLEEGVHRGDG